MAQTSTNNLVASSHCLVVREAGAAHFHLSASGRAALSGLRSRCHPTSAFRPSGATGAKPNGRWLPNAALKRHSSTIQSPCCLALRKRPSRDRVRNPNRANPRPHAFRVRGKRPLAANFADPQASSEGWTSI